MKRFVLPVALALLAAGCSDQPDNSTFASSTPSLTGKWVQEYQGEDNVTHNFIGSFKADGSYDAYNDDKVVVTGGTYAVKGDTLYLNDPSCSPHPTGLYKLIYYAQDSLRFELIADSCDDRRNGTISIRCKRMANQ